MTNLLNKEEYATIAAINRQFQDMGKGSWILEDDNPLPTGPYHQQHQAIVNQPWLAPVHFVKVKSEKSKLQLHRS